MKNDSIRILIVDDEPDILEFLEYNLMKEGYRVFVAENGKQAITSAKKEHPHLVILDIMMPEMGGIETCKVLRSDPAFKDTIIAFLTARNEEFSQISGFEVGADDYITKPIKPKVFVSRVKALLRRVQPGGDDDRIVIGELVIDKEKFMVFYKEKPVPLVKKEFEILTLLASRPGKVFRRQEILDRIWGNDVVVENRTIDVHITKLREKLGHDFIKTVKGVGYKFDW